MAARFITLEGIEGSGKSTQLNFILDYLHEHGIKAIQTREPGGTEAGELIREILLTNDIEGMHPDTELALMFAARIEHVNKVIVPALEAGQWVICDRFYDATYAYQGYGRKIDLEKIDKLREFTIGKIQPDLTLLLDVDLETSAKRVAQRGSQDRFENEKLEFYTRVREGYLAIARQHANRVAIIDSTCSPEQVQSVIVSKIKQLL